MSIFGDIVSSIFHHAAAPASAAPATVQAAAPGSQAAPPSPSSVSAPAAVKPAATPVDVAAIMDKLAGQSKESLDWRKSIVDLMKLLNLDSSLHARKQLAEELHYTGNMNDSAAMNVWLHKQVMIKLAENGGKVPAELRS